PVLLPVRSAGQGALEGEDFPVPNPMAGPAPPSPPQPATDGEEKRQEREQLPPLPGVLSGLAPSDLSALEQGLQQLLEPVGQMGRALTGDRDTTNRCLWVVAAALAAGACEVARRQLRQPAAPTVSLKALDDGGGS